VCGRYTLTAAPARVAEQLGLAAPPDLRARFNIAPGQEVPAVVQRRGGARAWVALRWGLAARAGAPLAINARIETAAERPSFRHAFRHARCLLPADGFYEWRRGATGSQPYHVALPGRAVFAFAALFDGGAGAPGGCAILTGPSRGGLRELHSRMPLLLAPEAYAAWLDPGLEDPERVRALLGSPLSEALELRAVDPRVNDARFDDPACLGPAPQLSLL
jgi:putative SOS response-associated peptidase YedK